MEKGFLPVVRIGTYAALTQTLIDEYDTDGEFIKKYFDEIHKSNPIVAQMILHSVEDLEGEEYVHTLFCMCTLYKLLENEAEARDFEAFYNLEENNE